MYPTTAPAPYIASPCNSRHDNYDAMIPTAFLVIQLGLAFVFLWTGVLIFRDTPSWAGILRGSWVARFLPMPPESAMRGTAVLDMVIGLWLLTGIFLWLSSLLAALHLVSVLLVTGIFAPSYRDVGLLAAALALLIYALPAGVI